MKFLILVFSLIIFHPFVLANSTQDSLNKQDKEGWALLHHAAKDDLKKAKELLEQGADPNIRTNWGRTPLHIAVVYKQLGIIHLLMKHGAKPNIKDDTGRTPLQYLKGRGLGECQDTFK